MKRSRIESIGLLIALLAAPVTACANLLEDPGFHQLRAALGTSGVILSGSPQEADPNLPALQYVIHQKTTRDGDHRLLGPWQIKAFSGRIGASMEPDPSSSGKIALRINFLGTDSDNHCGLGQLGLVVQPNTVYRLTGSVRTRHFDWVKSHCRFGEGNVTGADPPEGDHRRLVNASGSREFIPLSHHYTTGPNASRLDLILHLMGRPQVEGIVRQPSIVWLQNLRLHKAGRAVARQDLPEVYDFEGHGLRDWQVSQLGGSWYDDGPKIPDPYSPRLSREQAHSGQQSLKLTGEWGMVELPLQERLTDCVVSLWFFDTMEGPGHTRLVSLIDRRGAVFPHSAGNRAVGLGAYREAADHYSRLGGPLMPCPYCGRTSSAEATAPAESPATEITRSRGWHRFQWDFTGGQGVVFFIDGREVGHSTAQDGFRILQLGENYWNGFTCYIDDVRIDSKK